MGNSSKTIKCKIDSPLRAEYAWTLGIFSSYAGMDISVVESDEDILIAENTSNGIAVSHFFRNTYQSGDYHFKSYFRKEPLHYTAGNKPDYLSTCFYLLSFLQEYVDYHPDQHGRFPYAESLQKYFNCIDQNLVVKYFDALISSVPLFSEHAAIQKKPSAFFLSHDIDSLYKGLGDHFNFLVKKGRIGVLLQMMFNHYVRTPDYMQLDKILKIESEYDVRSTFFWIVNHGRGNRKIENADYIISDAKVVHAMDAISQSRSVNGLHKSFSRDSYAAELRKGGRHISPVNRNHYLLAELPDTFDALERDGIQLDATMGFADAIGFRNNYGWPVRPFHLKEKRPYAYMEVPLTIMDSTLKYYLKQDSHAARKTIFDFLENNRTNALISLLWHNNYFFDRMDTGWLQLYKDLLQYIRENKMEALTPGDILIRY